MFDFTIGYAPFLHSSRTEGSVFSNSFSKLTLNVLREYTLSNNPFVDGLYGKSLKEANETCGAPSDTEAQKQKMITQNGRFEIIPLSGADKALFDLGSMLRSGGLSVMETFVPTAIKVVDFSLKIIQSLAQVLEDGAILVSSKLSPPKTLRDFHVVAYVSSGWEEAFITDTVKSRLGWLEEFSQRKSEEIDAVRKRALRECAIGCEDEVWTELTQHLETLSPDEMNHFFRYHFI